MKFTLAIDCDNDAFGDADLDAEARNAEVRNAEVALLLQKLARRVIQGELDLPTGMRTFSATIHDSNGNDVGRATFEREGAAYR